MMKHENKTEKNPECVYSRVVQREALTFVCLNQNNSTGHLGDNVHLTLLLFSVQRVNVMFSSFHTLLFKPSLPASLSKRCVALKTFCSMIFTVYDTAKLPSYGIKGTTVERRTAALTQNDFRTAYLTVRIH